ncbi:unnamed protein product, partial [Mesorhabditis spiculigera]
MCLLFTLCLIDTLILLLGTCQLELEAGFGTPSFQRVIEAFPCVALIGDVPNLYAVSLGTEFSTLASIFSVSCINGTVCFFIGLHCSIILFKKRSRVSTKTRTLQKTFFFDMMVQLIVPLICLSAPWLYFIFAFIASYPPDIGLNNLLFAAFSSHGFLNSLSIIMIYRPYRLEFFRVISRRTWGEWTNKTTPILIADLGTSMSNREKPDQ